MGSNVVSGASKPRNWYSPHRAIIFLAVLLTLVAVGGGMIGVVNASRAEQATNRLSTRYLVLQTPVRQIRAAVAAFQIVAAEAFSGSTPTTTLVSDAVDDANSSDQAYVTLQHLLTLPGNGELAPRLPAQMTAFVAARSKLGGFLAGGPRTPETAKLASTELSAAAKLDAGLGTLQSTISDRLTKTASQAEEAAARARDGLLWAIVIGVIFAGTVTTLLARHSLRVEHVLTRREEEQLEISQRTEFEGRLQRALEMSTSEEPVLKLVAESLGDAAPDMRTELLLADSSRAHFRQVLVSSDYEGDSGCGVTSPDYCPAASRGQTMVFPSSTAIDACPNLRGRGCSALCVPVSISGNSVGVFHVTTTEDSPPSEKVRGNVEVVARRSSERLAMLRAFAVSQTQANSDSLTGLLTRRSLENAVRDLLDTGTPYSLAYADLDHFKEINDVFGHDAGDRALRTFAQVLRDSLRPVDIPCRYGGEEFVIVLPSCPIIEATQVLDRVRERLVDRLLIAQLPNFTVSFGLALSDQGDEFQRVVSSADEALLSAKTQGRDRIVIAASTSHRSVVSSSIDTAVSPLEATGLQTGLGDVAFSGPVSVN
jgi:diguanylate cyclase (GGDEF)-like protein